MDTYEKLHLSLDCSLYPEVPAGYELQMHKAYPLKKLKLIRTRSGGLVYGKKCVGLLEPEKQGKERDMYYCEFILPGGKHFLNAVFLKFLLLHQKFIPEAWEFDIYGNERLICSWGTTFVNGFGSLCARGMRYDKEKSLWFEEFQELILPIHYSVLVLS